MNLSGHPWIINEMNLAGSNSTYLWMSAACSSQFIIPKLNKNTVGFLSRKNTLNPKHEHYSAPTGWFVFKLHNSLADYPDHSDERTCQQFNMKNTKFWGIKIGSLSSKYSYIENGQNFAITFQEIYDSGFETLSPSDAVFGLEKTSLDGIPRYRRTAL